jgi:hypothetical protein
MTEQEQKHLVEEIGLATDDAERHLRDNDLWMLPPELTLALPTKKLSGSGAEP